MRRVLLQVVFAALLVGMGAAVASAEPHELFVFGKLNVNEATAEQLSRVPGLSKAEIERILEARAQGAIERLETLKISAGAARFLTVKGETTFTIVRKLPLLRLGAPSVVP